MHIFNRQFGKWPGFMKLHTFRYFNFFFLSTDSFKIIKKKPQTSHQSLKTVFGTSVCYLRQLYTTRFPTTRTTAKTKKKQIKQNKNKLTFHVWCGMLLKLYFIKWNCVSLAFHLHQIHQKKNIFNLNVSGCVDKLHCLARQLFDFSFFFWSSPYFSSKVTYFMLPVAHSYM